MSSNQDSPDVAIRPLALLLDWVGPIAPEEIVSLLTFGEAAVPAMPACIDSLAVSNETHGRRPDSAAPSVGATGGGDTSLPVNDNTVPGGLPDTTPLVADPNLVRSVRATLRRCRVAQQDLDDAIADVQCKSIEAARTRGTPRNLAEWKALATTIAVRWALDRLREALVRSKYDVGPCDDANVLVPPTLRWEHADAIDMKRYLAVLKDLFDSGQMPEHGEKILRGVADEMPQEEIAAEIGVSTTVVRNRLHRMRATFRARLAALGMLSLVLLLGVLLWPTGDPEVSAPRTTPVHPPAASFPGTDGGAFPDASENRPGPSDEIAPFPIK